MKLQRSAERRPRPISAMEAVGAVEEITPLIEFNNWRDSSQTRIIENYIKPLDWVEDFCVAGRLAQQVFVDQQAQAAVSRKQDRLGTRPKVFGTLDPDLDPQEFILGVYLFSEVGNAVVLKHAEEIRAIEQKCKTELGVSALHAAQFLIWIDWPDKAKWQKKLKESLPSALEEVNQETDPIRLLAGAADVVLSFPAKRVDMRALILSRWPEIRSAFEKLQADCAGLVASGPLTLGFNAVTQLKQLKSSRKMIDLLRFLRNLRVVLAESMRVDWQGRMLIVYEKHEEPRARPQALPARKELA